MTAPLPADLAEAAAQEVKRVTLAWSGPAMQEFKDDPPTRKQRAVAEAVLRLVRTPALPADLAEIQARAAKARELLPLEAIEYDQTQDYLAHLADDVDNLGAELYDARQELAELRARPTLTAEEGAAFIRWHLPKAIAHTDESVVGRAIAKIRAIAEGAGS